MQKITKSRDLFLSFLLDQERGRVQSHEAWAQSLIGCSSERQLAPHVHFALGTFHNTPPHFEKEGLHSS